MLSACSKPTGQNPKKDIKILFVGDMSFGENYLSQYEMEIFKTAQHSKAGYQMFFAGLEHVIVNNNLLVANLETPLTNLRKSPWQDKEYLHWSDPVLAPRYLKKNNINLVSLANNHTLDYGTQGLNDTFSALSKAAIDVIGAGQNAQSAARPFHKIFKTGKSEFELLVVAGFEEKTVYEKKYQFYAQKSKPGANKWSQAAAAKQLKRLRQVKPNAFIVAYPHWGGNYRWKNKKQTQLAHTLIDHGADLVLGHGSHMLQEIEFYKGKWIFYSLGNFIFNSPGRYHKRGSIPFSLMVQLAIREVASKSALTLNIFPIFTDNRKTNYQSRPLTHTEMKKAKKLLLKKVTGGTALENKLESQSQGGISFWHIEL
jgi:poly-gamma-glutamate capsule biosynthesis protein CapA/YwtB (metallophosphatase superfamily)